MKMIPVVGCLLVFALQMTVAAEEWRVEQAGKEVLLRGYTRSITSALISSEVSGRVQKVNYDIGDRIVEKPFAEIDVTFIDFDLQSTRIALARVETRLHQAQSRVDYLTKELKRKETLFEKGRSTEVTRDAASQELDQALLDQELILEEQQSLTISLDQLVEKKRRHAIPGHREWVVTDKKVEIGEIIQPGAPLAVIQDYRELVVPLAVSNEELIAIQQKGGAFDARLEGLPVTASIYHVNPEFNEKTRKIDIKLLIRQYPEEHRGGLRLTVPVMIQMAGVKIPEAAVVNRYENPKVYPAATGKEIPISILDSSDGHVIIAEHEQLPVGTLLTKPKG